MLSGDSWFGQRKGHPLGVQCGDGLVDRLIEVVSIDERLVCKMVCLEVVPGSFDIVQFGRIFGSHSTVSQCARAASAARAILLVWIGPLSSTSTTGLIGWPGLGPYRRSSCSR